MEWMPRWNLFILICLKWIPFDQWQMSILDTKRRRSSGNLRGTWKNLKRNGLVTLPTACLLWTKRLVSITFFQNHDLTIKVIINYLLSTLIWITKFSFCLIISHSLLVHYNETIFNQSATFSNVSGRGIDLLEDLSATFSNVNDRATSGEIEKLDGRMNTLLSNMTSFENITGK